jgi:hypothetical protein
MERAPDLKDAVSRLREFRWSRNEGEIIDELSGLTTDDVDAILSFVADFPSSD